MFSLARFGLEPLETLTGWGLSVQYVKIEIFDYYKTRFDVQEWIILETLKANVESLARRRDGTKLFKLTKDAIQLRNHRKT